MVTARLVHAALVLPVPDRAGLEARFRGVRDDVEATVPRTDEDFGATVAVDVADERLAADGG